ncbi:MAG: DinB family protein [Desulfobacteraceae bacterium]|nr:MAG: DinB family protein [Desulfobacteraceae bacterium]
MERRADIIEHLDRNLDETIAFFRSLTPEQFGRQVYADSGRWTVRQLLAHFVSIEKSMHRLFNNMLAGGEGAPADFDLERYNTTQVPRLDAWSTNELIMAFREGRIKTISIVRCMTEADLDRRGRHAFHGQGTLERFVRWAYEHANLHVADIRKALES